MQCWYFHSVLHCVFSGSTPRSLCDSTIKALVYRESPIFLVGVYIRPHISCQPFLIYIKVLEAVALFIREISLWVFCTMDQT